MKNLLTFLHPGHEFTEDHVRIVKIQLENTLKYWSREDTILVTNFPYSYEGFEALVVPDELFCEHRKRASKINVICHLLKEKILTEPCWFHDFDAFQVQEFPEIDYKEAGFTDYGYTTYWNTGSFFFQPSTLSIFELIKKVMYKRQCNEEQALNLITRDNIENINDRIVRLNSTYNLGGNRSVEKVYEKSEKPIKVVHFHPGYGLQFQNVKDILPEYLITLFAKHDYR